MMMMMTASTHEALYTPLLGDENFDQEKEQPALGSSAIGDQKKNDDDDTLGDVDDGGRILRCECLIFPFLLFVQFGLASLKHGGDVVTLIISWGNGSSSILLLTCTSWLYRGACADIQLDHCLILVILPEILIKLILTLALFNMVAMAYVAVLTSGLLLAILGFVATVNSMCKSCNKGQQEDENYQGEDGDGDEVINDKCIYSKQVELLIV
jgi:hypothetical protein